MNISRETVEMKVITLLVAALCVANVYGQKDPHFVAGRNTIVHLFEWKWSDIAAECENFLGPKGFGGVQISPPNENLVISNRPWYERYQPVSYVLTTRSGDEAALSDMIKRCNAVGVRIYVDAVINHMSADGGTGTAGSTCDANSKSYPAVPFSSTDFHATCSINNYNDAENVRNCELEGLKDLDQSVSWVREKIVEYFDHLVDLGVAGFRVDAAKHMYPADLEAIFASVKNLNTNFGFAENSRPFYFQEVIDFGGEAVSKQEYNSFGAVLEFLYGTTVGAYFQAQNGNKLANLQAFGPDWGLLEGYDAVAFIDNHDNQRHGTSAILTYKSAKLYKAAIAFMLAHPYGITRIMSSYAFDDADAGPPADSNGNIVGPGLNDDGTCTNGWVCEHRWQEIFNMVAFRNAAGTEEITNWWSNGDQQIAFGRGSKAFIAFTISGDLNQSLQTSLPAGTYCDVISGSLVNGACTGKSVVVDSNGLAGISLAADELDAAVAIHVNARL